MRMGVGAAPAVIRQTSVSSSEDVNVLGRTKEAGLKINPKTAEVEWRHALTLDPYGVYPDLPEECQQVGRQYSLDFSRKRHMGPLSTTCRRRPSMCGRREPQQHEIRRAAPYLGVKFH